MQRLIWKESEELFNKQQNNQRTILSKYPIFSELGMKLIRHK